MRVSWVRDNFGSRRGLVRHLAWRARWGWSPGSLAVADLDGVDRLVFVCMGNICRSAMAEAVARARGFPACSFGIDTRLDKPADVGMVQAAATIGHDLSTHQATPLAHYAYGRGDLLLLFDPDHFAMLKDIRQADWRIGLLGAWARPPRPYIHDPFGGRESYFNKVAHVIDDSVGRLVGRLNGQHG
jgi:protein-tyrosine phosphatase